VSSFTSIAPIHSSTLVAAAAASERKLDLSANGERDMLGSAGMAAGYSRRVEGRLDRRVMTDLWLGHLAADFSQGALPAILVFLRPLLHLSYTRTAVVVLVATVTSSIVQPLFGRWSDRRTTTWLIPVGVAASGVGIALAAVSRDYPLLLVVVSVSGLGVGAFHPEAMKLARHASGVRRASGMALFQTGGNLGIALGPVLAGVALTVTGSSGGLLFVIPAILVALLLVRDFGLLGRVRRAGSERLRRASGRDRPGAFRLLLGAIGCRSVTYYGLFTFVPLWEVSHGHSKSYGSALLSLVLFSGAIGTLCAGPLADRFGRKPVLVSSLALSPALVLVFVLVGGTIGAVSVCVAGAVIVSTFSVTTVMGQEYLPTRIAMASGMTIGLATGLGGVAAVALGAIADTINLRAALIATAIGPALGALVAARLPSERPIRTEPVLTTERS
jgi:FSR family fosmidomycin resistance protein-like MFS transporter